MSDYLDGLNDIQRQAVTDINGPVLVVAGPGSGKTRVLTYRIAYLIQQGVNPRSILALTFTNKAAREMKGRIEKVVGTTANMVWAGTFHSIFARLLRVDAPLIGYPSNFTIYDTDDAKSLINTIVKDLGLDKNTYAAGNILSRISGAKSQIITAEEYVSNATLRDQDAVVGLPHFAEIYKRYAARMKKAGAMDFDDLLLQLYILLNDFPEVLDKYRRRFAYVLVDEFQDTNTLQYGIIKKLVKYNGSKYNVCVVGDDAQSIYAFRGATIENILNFETDFPMLKTYKLEQNYRSIDAIVQAANEVISHNRKQIKKTIWTDRAEGPGIILLRALNDNEEAKRVVDAILEQKNRNHLRNSEIAILYRTNAQSRIFEEYLRRYNISYRVYGGMSFYQRKEVKDLLAYFKLSVNPYDDESLKRIINFPRRGIGDATIEGLRQIAVDNDISMWDVLQSDIPQVKSKKAVTDFTKMIQVFIKKLTELNAYDLAMMIARQSGVLVEYKKENSIDALARVENLNALLDGVKEFVENDEATPDEDTTSDKSLATYLQTIMLLTDADKESQDSEVVTLMSVHSAKGLEFKSVFVTGVEEKLFPSWMSYDVPDGIEEERRLFYVAITRAETHLTLSYANSRYRFGKLTYCEPSRFLDELSMIKTQLHAVPQSSAQQLSGVSGNFRPVKMLEKKNLVVDGVDFKVS
ncbi:MAG TPA: 3'-5' exonuclease, partial [Saprospiraceae bacterium]|nr:3'-5' exonuclease [Saprospiraceae bacterium]